MTNIRFCAALLAASFLTLIVHAPTRATENREEVAPLDSLLSEQVIQCIISDEGDTAVDKAPVIDSEKTQDPQVQPAGCCDQACDTCCGDNQGCCGEGCCGEGQGCCGEGKACCGKSQSCCNNSCCCEAVCCPKKVTEEVKKHCWLVKPEMVCIPGFRFELNWGKSKCGKKGGCCDSSCGCADKCCGDSCCGDSCCADGKCCCNDPGKPTCGRVRCINVLEKHEYTCEECGYEWEVKCIRTGKGRSCCGKNGCCCPSCGCASSDAAKEFGDDIQLTSSTESFSKSQTPQASQASKSRGLLGWLK